MILRSLTKLHAIPGLRLGFLLGETEAIHGVAALQPPWAVSAPAVAAGIRALEEAGFALRSRERVAETRRRLVAVLWRAGFAIPEPHANFILVDVGDGAGFRRGLMERGFVVRDCASFGLPGYVRVAIPHERDRTRLAVAMIAAREETAR
jgi:histidinol-phosphate/aromatic aminotransferase/cobyric acid decarboxylase-like protein